MYLFYRMLLLLFLQYRHPVAEWMIDVCGYFKLHITTAHAAIAYLDRLQPDENCERQEWQMIAVACILIASKYNESEQDVPPLNVFEEIIHQRIPNETMLTYELWVLRRISWQLNARTPAAFLTSFFSAGIFFEDDCATQKFATQAELEDSFAKEAMRLASVCLSDTQYKGFRSSDVASAIVFKLRKRFQFQRLWRAELVEMTSCDPLASKAIDTIVRMLDTVPLDDSLAALLGASRSTMSPSQLSEATDTELSIDMDTDSAPSPSSSLSRSITPSGVASQQFISISLNSARGAMSVNVEDESDKENAKSRVSPSSISNVGQFEQSPLLIRQPTVQPAPAHA